jgi:aspartyl-tRNA(Asn)/glutamyl-tRNA(Gln) amidotransferase subunit A
MGRTVDDVRLLAEVLTSTSSRDAVSWGGVFSTRPAQAAPDRVPGLRIGVCTTLGDYPVDVEVAAHVAAAADLLREAGAEVVEVTLPWHWEDIATTAWIHYGHLFAAAVAAEVDAHPDLVMPYTARFAERGRAYAERYTWHDGLVREGRLHDDLATVFADVDVLMAPAVAHTGLVVGDDYTATKVRIGHDSYDPWDVAMTVPFSIASRCPALAVPVGVASTGVPTGVQIVGPPYRDADVWRVGRMLEQPFVPPPMDV